MADKDHSVFGLMDGMIAEINRTKIILLVLLALIIAPFSLVAILVFTAEYDEAYYEDHTYSGYITFEILVYAILAAIVGFAIRQIISLHRWTKKYQRFKARQDELEKKSDDELKED